MSGARAVAAVEPRRTDSAEATERLGEAFAPHLAAGDVVVLTGPLGAGKTRFVAGLARGLGAKGRVRSPSFTLLHEYAGALPLFHADLYRLATARDVEGLGLDEALERGALVVEWGERLPAASLADALTITFAIEGEHARSLAANATGPRGAELLAAWRTLA